MPVKVFFQLDHVLLLCSVLAGGPFIIKAHFIPNMHLNFVTIPLCINPEELQFVAYKFTRMPKPSDPYDISTVLFIIYIQQFLHT